MNKSHCKLLFLTALSPLFSATTSQAQGIFSPNDFIIGIDGNRNLPGNTNTGGEGPTSAFDENNGTKWLSFGRTFSGLIVQPTGGAQVVTGIQFTTGGDAPERDPTAYQLWGRNGGFTTVNNGTGLEDSWTLISSGVTGLGPSTSPALARSTPGTTQNFANAIAYDTFKVVVTQLRKAGTGAFDPVTLANASTPNSVQTGEIRLFNAGAVNVAASPLATAAFDQTDSFSPATERPVEAIDGLTTAASKYLNFGREGSGLIITPAMGSTVAKGLQIWTANDVPDRDPGTYQIFGTNAPIQSIEDSEGTAEAWTLITSGALALPDTRNVGSGIIGFTNNTAYTSYKIIITDNKGLDANANSIQFSEIQLYTIPEPAALGLVGIAGAALLRRRRGRA